MADAQHIGHYQFAPETRLFFDTNIWLFLFDCRSDPNIRVNTEAKKIYAGVFARALKAQSQLFTHPFVISEFVNRLLRDEHNFLHGLNAAPKDFKTWRRSEYYSHHAGFVAARTRSVLNPCTLIEDNFNKEALLSRLENFEEQSRDLNDEFLIEVCERHNLTLVTHDGDFSYSILNVVTANTNYLKR